MRFVTFTDQAGPTRPPWSVRRPAVGVQSADGSISVLPAGTALVDLLDELPAAGRRALADPAEVVGTADVRLLPPLPAPPSVRDFMVFEQHVSGVRAGNAVPPEWYEQPVFYFTNPAALVGAHDDVPVPPGSRRLDFELEVAAVIGRAGTDLSPDRAAEHVVGYCVLNDWSARDLQAREMRVGLGPAKGKDSATTLGPALVTADELAPYAAGTSFDLGMRAEVNGELFGTDRLSSMHWSFGEMVAYASRGTWLRPGDVLGSGTCGSGCLAELWGRQGADARPSLQPGDVVTLTVDVLGTISNRVVAGDPAQPLR